MVTSHRSGFTIVELLVVIVVIAVLASITVVSYSGIQNQAKTAKNLSTAKGVAQKAELWNASVGSYPSYAQLVTNTLNPGGTPDAPRSR